MCRGSGAWALQGASIVFCLACRQCAEIMVCEAHCIFVGRRDCATLVLVCTQTKLYMAIIHRLRNHYAPPHLSVFTGVWLDEAAEKMFEEMPVPFFFCDPM